MKRIYNKCIGLAICGMLIACHSEDFTGTDADGVLQILSVNIDNEQKTKAEVTSIREVQVYTTLGTHVAYATNALAKYNLSGTSWTTDKPVKLTADSYVYAYYPATISALTHGSDGNHTIPVTIKSEDTFTGVQDDYLYGMRNNASTTSKAVNLTMKHALSKVSVQINKAESVTETLRLTGIEIVSETNRLQTGSGTMNLIDGRLNGLSSGSLITLTGDVELNTAQSSPNISFLTAPMSGSESVLSFRLTIYVDGETAPRTFETSSVSTSQQWVAAKQYVYTIKVDKMAGTFEGMKIYDWKSDASQNTQVGI